MLKTKMKEKLTVGNLLGIFIPVIVLIIGWGISVSSRLEGHDEINTQNKVEIERLNSRMTRNEDQTREYYINISDKLDNLIYKVGEKEDRKK